MSLLSSADQAGSAASDSMCLDRFNGRFFQGLAGRESQVVVGGEIVQLSSVSLNRGSLWRFKWREGAEAKIGFRGWSVDSQRCRPTAPRVLLRLWTDCVNSSGFESDGDVVNANDPHRHLTGRGLSAALSSTCFQPPAVTSPGLFRSQKQSVMLVGVVPAN